MSKESAHIDSEDGSDTSVLTVSFHHFFQGERTADVNVADEDVLGCRSSHDGVSD